MLHPDYVVPEAILGRFYHALKNLYKELPKFDKETGERALAFRLGVHLEKVFPGLNVDAEYNRNGTEFKRIKNLYEINLSPLDLKYLEGIFPGVSSRHKLRESLQPENGDQFYPDLIVHERGENRSNTLVVEVKRKDNLSLVDIHQDFKKLKALTTTYQEDIPYKYAVGLFLHIHPQNIEQTHWLAFINGEIEHELSHWQFKK